MTDRTIGSIKKNAKKIQELSKENYVLSHIASEEYNITFQDLLIDLERAIIRVITLCNTRNQFKDISSYQQRADILKDLKMLYKELAKGGDFLSELDNLKLNIKEFAYIKYVKTSAKDIESEALKLKKEISNTIKQKNILIKSIKTVSSNVDKTKENIDESKENKRRLDSLATTLNKYDSKLKTQDDKYKQYDIDIKTFKKEKDNTLKDVKKQHEELSKNVKHIHDEAKKAMRLGVAAGISAGFQAQYNEIKGIQDNKNDKHKILHTVFIAPFVGARVWVWGALLFAIIAIGIGIWLGLDSELKLNTAIARLSLMFISLTGAWFCAGQYVKISNIATDYAYKATLAKSIDAFSEKLKNKENSVDTSYKDYTKKMLDEIHKHPLRNFKKKSVAPTEKLIETIIEKLKEDKN